MLVLVPEVRRLKPLAGWTVAALAAAKLGLHLWVNATTPYGFHRDEFLYLAMGRHLRLWRMDFPPGIALLAESTRALLGDSLSAIRTGPALAGALLVVAAALFARELGGGRRAQALAALAVLASPLFLRSSNLFQPVVFDQLAWSAALFALARLCWRPDPRWWLALGVALGLGLLIKFSIAFVGLGIVAGILLSPLRRSLVGPWPWLALGIALLLGSPSLVGQWALGFPVLGQMRDLQSAQLERVTPEAFLMGQLFWGPGILLAAGGAVALLVARRYDRVRAVGWSCVATFAILLLLKGKPYYVGPVYPVLFAAGAVPLERSGVRWLIAGLILLFGAAILPLGVPIIAPERMAAYVAAIGATPALRTNTGELERLPQDYADMLGWEEQVRAVAGAYHALPEAERREAVILAGNYGEAGAIDLFGPKLGLPPAVSPTGSYWFFGPGDLPGRTVVLIGPTREDLAPFFDSLEVAGHAGDPWAVAEERDLTIFVARRPRQTLQEVWPALAGRN
jgi:4-amino-4-deoxy-L-arabinose transferase-like glycosyltransferase